MLKYFAQTVNLISTSVYRKPTFTGLFTNFYSFIPLAYKRSLVSCLRLTFAPPMKTFTLNLKLFGSCLTWMVSLPTCSIILSVASLIICSTLSPLFTQFLRKLSISVFPSLAHTLFKFAIKSPDFAMLLVHILTFDLFFAPLHVSLLSFLLRIKFPSLWHLVLYIYSSVDAVPRRMWVKPRAIYTPEYQNTWESLL